MFEEEVNLHGDEAEDGPESHERPDHEEAEDDGSALPTMTDDDRYASAFRTERHGTDRTGPGEPIRSVANPPAQRATATRKTPNATLTVDEDGQGSLGESASDTL